LAVGSTPPITSSSTMPAYIVTEETSRRVPLCVTWSWWRLGERASWVRREVWRRVIRCSVDSSPTHHSG